MPAMKLKDPDTCWNAWIGLLWILGASLIILAITYVSSGRELSISSVQNVITAGAADHGGGGGHATPKPDAANMQHVALTNPISGQTNNNPDVLVF
ncbi:MAG: hypothetical protein ACI9CF_000608 [Candidatus Omnitrophota bacterium]|jgi:hypothetical protein